MDQGLQGLSRRRFAKRGCMGPITEASQVMDKERRGPEEGRGTVSGFARCMVVRPKTLGNRSRPGQ
jgi:hypothetical protein